MKRIYFQLVMVFCANFCAATLSLASIAEGASAYFTGNNVTGNLDVKMWMLFSFAFLVSVALLIYITIEIANEIDKWRANRTKYNKQQ